MKNRSNFFEILIILIGEVIVGAITSGVYLAVEAIAKNDAFTYKVITGLVLGTAVVVANYLVLTVAVNRAINKVMAQRPEGEMTDEEIMEFAEKHQGTIKNAAAFSYILRTLTMLATFVLAFTVLKRWFAVFATVIPLLAFRPIIMAGEFFRKRWCK
jgi:hypothetical protein